VKNHIFAELLATMWIVAYGVFLKTNDIVGLEVNMIASRSEEFINYALLSEADPLLSGN